MRVDKLMIRAVAFCSPHDPLDKAARLMWEHDCGGLPVCADDGGTSLVGMITDRDICMAAMLQGKPLHELTVDSAMAHDVVTCRPDEPLSAVGCRMGEARIRRLPVTDRSGNLAGIISMADLVREAARQQNLPHHELSGAEVCAALAAVCTSGKDRPTA